MQAISRRATLGAAAAFVMAGPARAAAPEELQVETEEGRMALSRYAADRAGRRPSVLILHGSRGVELNRRAYERYADRLAAGGIDAWCPRYFTEADSRALDPGASTPESRDAHNTGRFEGWARRIASAVTAIGARADSAGRIGLLGFSLGGYVAAATAARDQHIAALAVLYGGMPAAMVAEVRHLPPLLALHGEADRSVPVAKGRELVALAGRLGTEAELVTYPGRGHGFDFSESDPMAADALERIARFLVAQLGGA